MRPTFCFLWFVLSLTRSASRAVANGFNWAEGGHPNSVPWYVSTAGYGVLRNTWKPGAYSFGAPPPLPPFPPSLIFWRPQFLTHLFDLTSAGLQSASSVIAAHNETLRYDGFIMAVHEGSPAVNS